MQYCNFCQKNISKFKTGNYDTRFGVKGSFDIYRCNTCNLVQLNTDSVNYETKRLYETYYNFDGGKESFYAKIRTAFFNSPFYRLWIGFDGDISFHSYSGRGRLLDIGCNEGRNLQFYEKNGFYVEGIELNTRAAIEARKLGYTIYNESLENFAPQELYDVTVLSNVLEHSHNPKRMLLDVSRILKPGGQVWISCPNLDSWQRLIFRQYWINWHVPFHISFFSATTLTLLLNHTGFQVKKKLNLTPSLWMAQSIIAILFAREGEINYAQRLPILIGFLFLIIRIFLFPILCFGNLIGRGDGLIIQATK